MPTGHRLNYAYLTQVLEDALLKAGRNGLTLKQMAAKLDGLSLNATRKVLRKLRLRLGQSEHLGIPWRADGNKRIYFLTGQYSDGTQWHGFRLEQRFSQLPVDIAWFQSLAAAIDGRTAEGKKIRLALKHYQRLDEDIREVDREMEGRLFT